MDDDKIKALQGADHNWPDDARAKVRELLEELRQVEEEAHEAVRVMQERIAAAEAERDQMRTSRDRAKSMCADLDREVESLRKRLRIGGR
jgi:chromosome segregation ATPase